MLSEAEKGIAFERLTQLYLQTAPEYQTKLQDVWLLRDVPVEVRRRLKLPGPRDEGIDRLNRTHAAGKILGDTGKIPQPTRQASQPDSIEHLYELGVSYLHQYFFGSRRAYRH